MSDNDVVRHVMDELMWDPIVDPEAVSVAADDGTVTLRGTVGSYVEKRHAKRAAERVKGVKRVDNQLDVQLMTLSGIEDADLRGAVLQALLLDALIPSTIDAKVKDGIVTLTGWAPYNYQRDEAEFVAGNVLGVLGVDDEVELRLRLRSAGLAGDEDAFHARLVTGAGGGVDDADHPFAAGRQRVALEA